MHQLRVVDPDLVGAGQPAARTIDEEAVAFLLLWRHAVERDFGVAAEGRRIGHCCGFLLPGHANIDRFAPIAASRQDAAAMTLLRSRRGVLRFGALLVAPMTALAKPEDAKPGGSLSGQLLVATPDMSDPRFKRTVILMVQHNGKGALGIAINRPVSEVP